MERFNAAETLTSSEAAELLDVHPSTIKRWCNDGELAFSTTPGGHRRIRLDDAVALARAKDIPNVLAPFHPYEGHVWRALQQIREEGSFHRMNSLAMGWLSRSHLHRIARLFEAVASHAGLPLIRFCDEAVAGFMKLVGDEWAQGRLRVGEEHLVSQTMTEVLLTLRSRSDTTDELGRDEPAGVAVIGTLEGNLHGLGSLCVRLFLESKGWTVYYLGPDVPAEDFALIQRGREANLVCISAPPEATAGTLARTVRSLSALYDPSRPYALAFGGSSIDTMASDALEGPFDKVGIFPSCGTFGDALTAGFVPLTTAAR